MFEVLASTVAEGDLKLVETLCRQIAFPSRQGNIALANSLLERLDGDLVTSFLAAQMDDAFLWVPRCPLRSLPPTSKFWPAVISDTSTLEVGVLSSFVAKLITTKDALIWLSHGVDLVLDHEVNFDRSFLAVRKLVNQRIEASDERVIACLHQIFQLLLSASSSSAPVGLSVALMCDRLVGAAPVACTEVVMTCSSEVQMADLMIAGLKRAAGFV